MRLHWKLVLIVSSVTLGAMTCFFVYDYYLARGGMDNVYAENLQLGANLRQIISLISTQMYHVVVSDAPDAPKASKRRRADIQAKLAELRLQHALLMDNVLNVYVTDWTGTTLGAMNDRGDTPLPDAIPVDDSNLDFLSQSGIYVGKLSHRYNGQRASVAIAPYYHVSVMPLDGIGPQEHFAFVQIIYSTEHAWMLLNSWRMRHLIYVLVVGLVLQSIVITLAVIRMVGRPFQQIISALERAEEGELDIRTPVRYSDSGIERLVLSLYRLLNKMRLAQRTRIAELGTLAAGLTHEIGNPLNVIAMRAEYLKRRLLISEPTVAVVSEIQESLDVVMEEVTAIKQVTRQFANLTRPLVLERESTDINQLLDSVLNGLSVACREASVEIVRQYEDIPIVWVDPGKVRQAILNLAQNAIQAMSARGGRLYVATSVKKGITGERLVVHIRDTGPGMASHILEHIFETYFTTRENEGGLGLGLPITRQIVQAHDGQIEVQSQEGMGTVFSVFIPISDDRGTILEQQGSREVS